MRYATLCSGIEGFGLGFDRAGMECVYQCELDKTCRSVLERHWPGVERGTDVNDDCTAESLRRLRPDVLAFGFPCQDLSVAGRRAGLAGNRSGLFFRCAFLIAQCRPHWVCIENVPGLLSSNGGRDMGAVLGTLGELGYRWAYRVLDAQYLGLAQRRERVFIVASLGAGPHPAEILFDSESLPGNPPPSRQTGARIASTLTSGVASGRGVNASGRRREDDVNIVAADYAPPLTGNSYGDHESREGLLVAAYGGGNTSGDLDVATCLTHHGNRQDFDTETFIAHTLRGEGFDASEDGTGRGTPIVPVAYRTSGNCGVMEQGDRTAALNCASDPTQQIVAYQQHGSDVGRIGALRRGNGDVQSGVPFILKSGMAVRRLLPVECEALQGFPRDWTRWGADGAEISDSARYRMLGNAVAVPVAEWIGRRIIEFDR